MLQQKQCDFQKGQREMLNAMRNSQMVHGKHGDGKGHGGKDGDTFPPNPSWPQFNNGKGGEEDKQHICLQQGWPKRGSGWVDMGKQYKKPKY